MRECVRCVNEVGLGTSLASKSLEEETENQKVKFIISEKFLSWADAHTACPQNFHIPSEKEIICIIRKFPFIYGEFWCSNVCNTDKAYSAAIRHYHGVKKIFCYNLLKSTKCRVLFVTGQGSTT